jgi:hypothetical protein
MGKRNGLSLLQMRVARHDSVPNVNCQIDKYTEEPLELIDAILCGSQEIEPQVEGYLIVA